MSALQNNPIFAELEKKMSKHNAVAELNKFGDNLKNNVLSEEGLYSFFGTLWAFFREVPTGILALALRVSDDWMAKGNEWEATSKAAPILYANVDEFGLQSDQKLLPTHHGLFIKLMDALNLNRKKLLQSVNILPGGKLLGQATFDYYRNQSIPAGIGFHMASEFTSSLEFQHFLDGFKTHLDAYGLTGSKQSTLAFFQIHTLVEPLHLELGKLSAIDYLETDENSIKEIERGAIAFMNGFEKLFSDLNSHVFEEVMVCA